MHPMDRRQFIAAATPAALMAMSGLSARALPKEGSARPFSFELLRARAAELAKAPYKAPPTPPATVAKINYDAVQKIKFKPERALWRDAASGYPVRLFHVNEYNQFPVRIHMITDGTARELIYSRSDFACSDPAIAQLLPAEDGYSGFRIMDGGGKETDWLAFQGASYFRSSGQEAQYGASARGIAVNTALERPEEFPRFVEFWLEEPASDAPTVTIYALLDGPSITGAYRFDAVKDDGAVMDVSAELFVRTDIERLGLAPLTSMFWYGSADRRLATDWRPEIHDSDGLAMWAGNGERIWRPLLNPTTVRTNSFLDKNPKGFGLMQRQRDFESYQDDGAFYDKRPSIWIEPKGDWGEGAVQLVEIPTIDEIHDNIVAYWQPRKPVKAGDELAFAYRLYWQNDEPNPPETLARVVTTRTGAGGVPGRPHPDDHIKRKFVIDFAGGPLKSMAARFDLNPVVTVSDGTIDNAYVIKVVGTDRWRALFDLGAEGSDPVDLRCYLRLGDETLTETWMYQYLPEARTL